MTLGKKVNEAGLILGGLGILGFIGIVWLMIYGNLSGNLGFQPEAVVVVNETGGFINTTGYTLAGASDTGATGFAITSALNSSDNATILAGNYTLSATGVVTNATTTVWPTVKFTYTYSRNSQSENDAEGVIGNQTGGFLTFFGFSNTFFTIGAIVLLIFMLVGLLAVVMSIAKGRQDKQKSGFSGY